MHSPEQFKNIRFDYKIWLSTDDGINLLGDGKWKILKAIEQYGSLKAATDQLGITYRRTWGDLKRIEEHLGFHLLEKNRGGKHGGKTNLTGQGKLLVEAFDEFHAKVDGIIEDAFENFKRRLQD
jgi:molybdate transport system regulatory protein